MSKSLVLKTAIFSAGIIAFLSFVGVKGYCEKLGNEMISIGSFPEDSVTNYAAYNDLTQQVKDDLAGIWGFLQVMPAKAHFESKGGVCKVVLDTPGDIDWQVQLTYFPCNLKAGKSYKVSFDVKADAARKLGFKIGKISGDWFPYSGLKSFDVTTNWQTVSFVFKSPATDDFSRWEFECAADKPSFYFRNISLKTVQE